MVWPDINWAPNHKNKLTQTLKTQKQFIMKTSRFTVFILNQLCTVYSPTSNKRLSVNNVHVFYFRCFGFLRKL